MASSSERAVNFALRVSGVDEATRDFQRVGTAGEQTIASIAKAAAAQATYENALGRANSAAQAFAAAQAAANQEVVAAKTALKAGEMSEADYGAAVLRSKNAVELVRAEYRAAKTDLAGASSQVVAARVAANDLSPALATVAKHSGNARIAQMELMGVMRGVTDAIASGQSPIRAISSEMGRLSEAAVFAGGSLGKLGAFLSTGWGIAAALALPQILQVAYGFLNQRDAVGAALDELQKHAEKSHVDELAQQRFADTLAGVTQAIEENRKAIAGLSLVQDTEAEKALKAAAAAEQHAYSVRKSTIALLENAKAARELIVANAGGGTEGAEAQGFALMAVQGQIDSIQRDLDKANSDIAEADRQSALGRAAVVTEEARGSPEDRIKKNYDKQIDAAGRLTAALQSGAEIFFKTEDAKRKFIEQTNGALARQVKTLEDAKQAEIKRYQESQRHPSNAQTGRELTSEEAKAIAEKAGLQVNSSSRSYADQKKLYDAWVAAGRPKDNPVAAPGTSAHEGAKGRWALDIQLANGVTPELLRKVFAAQGVQLSKVFLERGHYHVEGSRSQSDAAAAAADKAEQDAQREKQDYQNRLSTLMTSELEARKALITNPEALAQIQRDEIEVTRRKYDENLKSLVKEGKLQGDHATELQKINDETAVLRQQLVERQEQERKITEANAADQRSAGLKTAQIGHEEDLLHGQEDLVRTQAARREIEHRLIDLQFQQEKIQNDLIISQAERLREDQNATEEAKKDAANRQVEAQLRNESLGTRQAQALARSDLQTASPLDTYLKAIPRDAAEINEKVSGYVADELESVRRGIDDAINKAIGVKDPLLAGIIDLFVEEVLIRPIGDAIRNRTAGAGSGGGLGGFLSKLLGFAGQAAGAALGGGGGGGLSGEALSTLNVGSIAHTLSSADIAAATSWVTPAFASGTPAVPMGHWFEVGENGRELMRYAGGNRLEVAGSQQSRRLISEQVSGPVLNQTIMIPALANPRLTASTIARGTQVGIARATKSGLARPAIRPGQ